jgi:sialate O-acetylesterase
MLIATQAAAAAPLRLPRVFTDNAVLQRDEPVRVWGWGEPGRDVTVELAGHSARAVVDATGAWAVRLPTLPAGGPHVLNVTARPHHSANAADPKNERAAFNRPTPTETLTVANLLIGDVWLGAGQSNMEWRVVASRDGGREVAAADFPEIRLLQLPHRHAEEPVDDVDAQWKICSPRTISWFSGVAYFFGRELHRELDVPIGLIQSAVSGTRIEPWTPAEGIRAVAELADAGRHESGTLYNGMIHPLVRFPIRGIIWYQGEGNIDDGFIYFSRMKALILGYRKAWSRPNLPFYYVQLAPLNWGPASRPKTDLPEIWEAQTAAMAIPHTGMVVTNDIGNTGTAHPRNKQEVGRRLALWALAETYGHDDIVCRGPIFESMAIEGDTIRVRFRHCAGGLTSRDGEPLTWFTIAGADGRFVPAEATIDGDSILVRNEKVAHPKHVRFAWHQIAEPNLAGGTGLPASAFRTDGTVGGGQRAEGSRQ